MKLTAMRRSSDVTHTQQHRLLKQRRRIRPIEERHRVSLRHHIRYAADEDHAGHKILRCCRRLNSDFMQEGVALASQSRREMGEFMPSYTLSIVRKRIPLKPEAEC